MSIDKNTEIDFLEFETAEYRAEMQKRERELNPEDIEARDELQKVARDRWSYQKRIRHLDKYIDKFKTQKLIAVLYDIIKLGEQAYVDKNREENKSCLDSLEHRSHLDRALTYDDYMRKASDVLYKSESDYEFIDLDDCLAVS